MEQGNIVEYIDRQKIICSVVLEVKNQRLRLLTETNREVNLSSRRLSHTCNMRLDLSMGRHKMVDALKATAARRNALISHIDIKELWEVLNTEQEWIDLKTMTEFCFPDTSNCDHESSVQRAFFQNKRYFKFNYNRFFPNTQESVEKKVAQEKKVARRNRMAQEGGDWLAGIINDNLPSIPDDKMEIVNLLKSFYLFEKENEHYDLGKAILARAGIDPDEGIFKILAKLGVFDENENTDLHRYNISPDFPEKVMDFATERIRSAQGTTDAGQRKDLTMLSSMTIDGQSTLDFDDAISIEDHGDHYRLGVHIVDVGHFVKKGDLIDREAIARGSSIYMPDQKIPMLPTSLAEDLCSLKAGQLRPAISILVNLTRFSEIIDYEIVPSMIKVEHQLTYYDVNTIGDDDQRIIILRDIAEKFRQKRMAGGAVQITLPDINVWVGNNGEITVSRINRESPARMLVSEIMIMANWLMAKFLAKHNIPAIYRSQKGPRERLYKGAKGTLFQNCMQRKMLSRFVLGTEPENHSGLGLNAYVTATSPIRKYFDLATQRQIRGVLGLEAPSTSEEIDGMIQVLELPMSHVMKLQHNRHRYWLLKYLEKRIGQKEEAVVLYKKRDNYQILITEYMIEKDLSASSGIDLHPEDLIQVTIQHVNARKNVLSIFMG
ncbi:MAG: RNB domain-containing ribonuclease [Deltaproteobacteria bacterium]|nr:RNB domain-containing ribonuclease [Deltaproteobacteria bacterium]MBW1969148.1 RNB domain-containing ribonuclease [Deltaproteobacteria bacterium]MBW2227804.1 RNB domain-containing ribonuclease [Deltaproteobacteria bacterium]MBW2325333.1 RNB domain-containing ribonuclease [Deltaproteobacteria bacterium]